jgi:RNA polymerase sigma-70 factor (ECF subfamily)
MQLTREERFAALVERESRFVFRVAYSILRNAHDSEDVVQDTFLKIYRLNAWENINDERAYLARAAWRIAVDRLPKVRVQAQDDNQRCGEPDPEAAAIAADLHGAVHRLIDALPEDLRQPLALSTVDEMSSREIADVIGIPEGTVRTRLMRARQILKEKMAQWAGVRNER